MKKLIAISILAVAALAVANVGHAGTNPNVNLALDVLAKTGHTPGSCVGWPSYSSCSVITPARAATGISDVGAVIYRFVGITAAEFSVHWNYSTAYMQGFNKCSDLDVTAQGTNFYSTQLAWSACQSSPAPDPGTGGILAAWARMSATAATPLTVGNPSTGGAARVVDCAFNPDEFHTLHNGSILGTAEGLPPCTMGPTAVEPKTWSGVKALYR